jgi:hypothetical protein
LSGEAMKLAGIERPNTHSKRERNDVVAALGSDHPAAARADDDVPLAVDGVGRRRRIDARAGEERPKYLAGLGVVGSESAVALACEHEPAGVGEGASKRFKQDPIHDTRR